MYAVICSRGPWLSPPGGARRDSALSPPRGLHDNSVGTDVPGFLTGFLRGFLRTEVSRRRLLSPLIGILLVGILLVGMTLVLGACAHHHHHDDDATPTDTGLDPYPANYKSDILAAMHAYLNDPTGIRDAAIAEPAFKAAGGVKHYVVCVRYNAKSLSPNAGKEYAGVKDSAAVFIAGRFDHFVEAAAAAESCAGVTYTPFPELEKLSR